MNWKKLLFLNVFLVVAGVMGAVFVTNFSREQAVARDEQRRIELYEKILGGASVEPMGVDIDFSRQISIGSPLIFGGAHTPPDTQQDAWDKIAEAGVTSIRKDLFLELVAPRNITLTQYSKNEGDLQNPKNWNKTEIGITNSALQNARDRRMKTIAILSYAPSWLTYSNTGNGVPRDWAVYKDVVKKTYIQFRSYIDYLEIWNEPNMPNEKVFLDVTGSGMTKIQAYELIYKNAAEAVREVDNEVNDGRITPLGGPVSFTKDDASFLEPLLANSELSKNLDFVSYHEYRRYPTNSDRKYRELMEKYGRQDLPVFLTEWNYSSKGREVTDVVSTASGIAYAGNMLTSYLRMGLAGANYHTLTAQMGGKHYGLERDHAFYTWENDRAELLPLARTWRLMSRQMGLGLGESRIYDASIELRGGGQRSGSADNSLLNMVNQMLKPDSLISIGFRNSEGQYGAVIVNSAKDGQGAELILSNSGMGRYARARVYLASGGNDARVPAYEGLVKAEKEGDFKIVFYVPAESVTGVLLEEEKAWYEQIFD